MSAEPEPDLVTQLGLSIRLEELRSLALECMCDDIEPEFVPCMFCKRPGTLGLALRLSDEAWL
jgi:hypothetical protein